MITHLRRLQIIGVMNTDDEREQTIKDLNDFFKSGKVTSIHCEIWQEAEEEEKSEDIIC